MSLDVRIKKSFGDYTLDVAFAAGDETLGFLGASGCGKSLTLRCIAGIETPDAGRIVVNDKVFFDSEQKINLTPQQRKTALLFQNYMLFPNLTVADNIGDHMHIVVHPDVVEVVHGVFETTPLSVLVQTGLINVEIAQAALLMGLAVPEIMGKCFHIVFHYLPS